MTSHRADDLNGDIAFVINTSRDPRGGIKEADGTLSDNDDLNPEGKRDQATLIVQRVVDQHRWHYYHLSTP